MTHFTHTLGRAGIAALAGAAGLAILGAPLAAQDAAHSMMTADEMAYGEGPPFLPAGVGIAVLSGNPGEAGVFVLRLRFPEGYVIPPHTHTLDELVTVISGELGIAMGDMMDRADMPMLGAGAFAMLPANMSHYAWADVETVVQVTGEGPFDITYITEADDPRIN